MTTDDRCRPCLCVTCQAPYSLLILNQLNAITPRYRQDGCDDKDAAAASASAGQRADVILTTSEKMLNYMDAR